MDTVVYIHGVVGDRDPKSSHEPDYEAFRRGVAGRGVNVPPLAESVTVEWGWETPEAGASGNLSTAQRTIAARIAVAEADDRWSLPGMLVSPILGPIRDLLLYGFSDILYYTGREGKHRVRDAVWKAILDGVGPDIPTDLTIVSHSGGTLIAHDFLFWVFSGERDDRLDVELGAASADQVRAARENWRVRRLITMGSPIAPLMVRSGHLVDLLARPGHPTIDVLDLGMNTSAHDGSRPLWMNLWDLHDPISFPLAEIYGHDRIIDLYTDHSDSLTRSHSEYWSSPKVHDLVASHWAD